MATAAQRPAETKVCGLAAVQAALERREPALRRLLLRADRVPMFASLLSRMAARRLVYRLVDDAELARFAGTTRHQGVAAVFAAEPGLRHNGAVALLRGTDRPLAVYLDGVGNPHNLGAIARTAAHFDVTLLLQRATPGAAQASAAAYRVASGGLDAVPLALLDEPLATLDAARSEAGVRLLAVTQGPDAADLYDADLCGPVVLLLGEEQAGLDPALRARCHGAIRVPGSGAVESLNVAAAAAVVLGEAWRQRSRAP
jgi:TrmH RNA methyltransferase